MFAHGLLYTTPWFAASLRRFPGPRRHGRRRNETADIAADSATRYRAQHPDQTDTTTRHGTGRRNSNYNCGNDRRAVNGKQAGASQLSVGVPTRQTRSG